MLGSQQGAKRSMERLGADIVVLPGKASSVRSDVILFSGQPINLYMSKQVEQRISHLPGVKKVTSQLFVQTLNASCCSLGKAYRLVGFNQKTDFVVLPWLKSMKIKKLAPDQIIVGSSVANSLRSSKAVILDHYFQVAGKLDQTGSSIDNTVFMPISSARQVAKNSSKAIKFWKQSRHQPSKYISAVLIKVKDQKKINEIVRGIMYLGDFKVVTTAKVFQFVGSQLKITSLLLISLIGILLLVSIVSLLFNFVSNARHRQSESGILSAIGASRAKIFALLGLEAIFSTGIGSLAGLLIGVSISGSIQSYLRSHFQYPLIFPNISETIVIGLLCLLGAITLGLIASAYPAWLSASQDPAAVIAKGELE